jgi:hypothetical protein
VPYEYKIDIDKHLVRERYSGTVTLKELIDCAKAEWADPAYRKNMNFVSDFRDVTYKVSQAEMRSFAALLAANDVIGRQAFVVSNTLGIGLSRMFSLTAESSYKVWDVARTFTDIDEAERWVLSGK